MAFKSSQDSWTRYWRAGNQDTCFTATGAFSVGEHWRGFFQSLPSASRILDLATGNGAVALIAAEVSASRQARFEITAVDQADIDPGRSLPSGQSSSALLAGIRFLPNTFLENLPFAEPCFDAVCSQFGFEYADSALTVPGIVTASKPGAELCLLVHARNGEIERASRNRLKRVRLLLEKGGLVDTVTELARLPMPANRARVEKLERRCARRHQTILERCQGAGADDVALNAADYLYSLVRQRAGLGSAELRGKVAHAEQELRAYIVRLNTMINAARRPQDMEVLKEEFGGRGFHRCGYESLQDARGAIAWLFRATKA